MSRPIDWSHELVLEAEPVSASKARDFVSAHLAEHGLPNMVDDVRSVTSELATNAVAHARTPFVLTLSATNGSVLLTVRDGSTSMPVTIAPKNRDVNGRGLLIVQVLSQSWGVLSDGLGSKSVWASFAASPGR